MYFSKLILFITHHTVWLFRYWPVCDQYGAISPFLPMSPHQQSSQYHVIVLKCPAASNIMRVCCHVVSCQEKQLLTNHTNSRLHQWFLKISNTCLRLSWYLVRTVIFAKSGAVVRRDSSSESLLFKIFNPQIQSNAYTCILWTSDADYFFLSSFDSVQFNKVLCRLSLLREIVSGSFLPRSTHVRKEKR